MFDSYFVDDNNDKYCNERLRTKKRKKTTFYYSDGSASSKKDLGKILHRLDGPAIEYSEGGERWYKNGRLHRLDGPAFINSHGRVGWFVNGKHHREGGPALIYRNMISYFKEGKLSRGDGPAVAWEHRRVEFWESGQKIEELSLDHLLGYAKLYGYDGAMLLTDPDEMIRKVAYKYLNKLPSTPSL